MPSVDKAVVTNVRKDRKGLQIGDDWYSAFNEEQLGSVKKGDTVSFTWTPKGTYKNIKGNVKIEAPAADAAVSAVPKSSGGFVAKAFPVPPLHPDRSIIRQNSLTHAVKMYEGLCHRTEFDDMDTMEEHVGAVINFARMFEAYSAGDLDRDAADEAVREMLATDHD